MSHKKLINYQSDLHNLKNLFEQTLVQPSEGIIVQRADTILFLLYNIQKIGLPVP